LSPVIPVHTSLVVVATLAFFGRRKLPATILFAKYQP
jgi:hypothetical protein